MNSVAVEVPRITTKVASLLRYLESRLSAAPTAEPLACTLHVDLVKKHKPHRPSHAAAGQHGGRHGARCRIGRRASGQVVHLL